MKITIFAAFFGFAAQAMPATLQIYPPSTAGEAPTTIRVASGGDLQAALDRAKSGDVVELAAGATFTGNYVLPAKTGLRYSVLRTAAAPGFPDASTRVEPAQSGTLARIQSPNSGPALRTAPGAHHWRLVLLELGPNATAGGDVLALGDSTDEQAGARMPHDLIVDRCYIHGDPGRGQKRGIAMNSASTTVINSYIADIKAVGQDAQAIAGWSGPGPFLIENNYLEASGENFMLGGSVPATQGLVPSDLVFRRNHVSRPVSWRSEKWSVKNLFELKNARRVLVEGNLFENNWADAQPGFAIVLTPRGEHGAAPWATVEDVTFRYNIVRDVAAGFNLLKHDDAGVSGALRRVRIADNLIVRVDRQPWGGNGAFMQIGEGPDELVVEHNTVLQSGNVLTIYGGSKDAPSTGERFVFRNNITVHNSNGVIGQGLAIGNDSLNGYFPGAMFLRNVLAGGRSSRYPADNLFPEMERLTQQFTGYTTGDYRLKPDSEFRRAASDGGDLGVNFIELARALGPRARQWLSLH